MDGMTFADKAVLVTGGATGIGRAQPAGWRRLGRTQQQLHQLEGAHAVVRAAPLPARVQ